jgi:putative phage repressor
MALIPQDIEKRIDIAFQKRVIDLMDEHELSKKQLAEKADISVAVISRITIYGIIPSLGILVKLADTFNISLSYLLAENNDSSFYKTNNPVTFQKRLHDLAAENNVKFSQIVHQMPFTKNYFYEWDRTGTIPSLEYLQAIADYFNVSPDYLLGRTDYKD